MSSTPLVTVGVPVYNTGKYLEFTLEAVRQQSLENIEVLIADNASTDDSLEIAQRFASEDPRFRVLTSDANHGSTWNYNRLLAAASAPLFMWNSADDVILPDHLASCRRLLLDHPDAVAAFSRAVAIDANGEQTGQHDDAGLDFLSASPSGRLDLYLRHRIYYAAFAGLYRTKVLRDVGGYKPMYGQDLVLATRLMLRSPWVQSQEQTYQERFHGPQARNLQYSDPVEQAKVFDPDYSLPVAFPQWLLNLQLFGEALTAPIPVRERARAAVSIMRHYSVREWRFLPYDVKRNVIRLARGRYSGAYDAL